MTDDLHDPGGVIDEAQRLAAETFGAERTFFLVNGSTVGNLAMVLAACHKPGELIIVQRNAHKSVLNGLKLAEAKAVFLMPAREEAPGLDIVPSLAQVEQALLLFPEARAVLLTNPSYYGFSVDLKPYAELIHRYDRMLLVDEAHGAHFGLHPAFPRSALQAGADAVVQSTHKTLPALTMGAMLHVRGERIDRVAVQEALRMLQSSSPSYPIMASLDITRAMIDVQGTSLFAPGIEASRKLREWAEKENIPYDLAETASTDLVKSDPLRFAFCDRTGSITGFELQKRLEAFGCYAEMADSRYVVLVVGLNAEPEEIARLQHALIEIAKDISIKKTGNKKTVTKSIQGLDLGSSAANTTSDYTERSAIVATGISEPVAFSRLGAARAAGSQVERIALSEAEGRLASEAVVPYPPGIPLLYEGERISADMIATIQRLMNNGARCQGAADTSMRTIGVLAER